MRVLLPLFVLLFATCRAPDSRNALHQRAVHWVAPGVFDPSLPPCSRLRRTRGGLCAIGTDAAFWIEGGTSTYAQEMSRNEPGSALVDATAWGRRSAELWRGADGLLQVSADLGDGWRPRPIPPEMQPTSSRADRTVSCAIAACGDTLVVCGGDSILRHEQGRWSRVAIDLRGRKLETQVRRALLVGRELYVGVEDWQASELILADIDTGLARYESDSFPEGARYVRDVDLGPDGRVYVTCSANLMSTGGQVLVRDGSVWSVLLSSPVRAMELICGNAPPPLNPPPAEPSHTFLALAFDGEHRACVLTEDAGLLRRGADAGWTCITSADWDYRIGARDLEIRGPVAYIASWRVGVLALDLDTLEGKRLRTH